MCGSAATEMFTAIPPMGKVRGASDRAGAGVLRGHAVLATDQQECEAAHSRLSLRDWVLFWDLYTALGRMGALVITERQSRA